MEQTTCTAMQARIAAIRARMEDAARRAGRNPQEIRLCAACKTQETETVRASAHMAIDLFGENHVQELVEKYDAGAYEGKEVHFIGHLQTNKVKKVVGRADVIESVDSQRLLDVIEREAEKQNRTQMVFLEVNIGGEASKSGVAPDELLPLLTYASSLPHIRVTGLMAIPPVLTSEEQNRGFLRQMAGWFRKAGELSLPGVSMQELSMGMSGDFENAILEGATLVRIGTAIYGARDYSKK
ncbi:MAG: YggS family pyridoxal phosphate-dependent enzyme [Clostridia bacterium]|nr:YggS family pyridoxal phosphate-dependent enzyme [Clostridia bacterium]